VRSLTFLDLIGDSYYLSMFAMLPFILQTAMQGFTEKIVGMMKSENLFASQGGPIILSQVSYNCISVYTLSIVWCKCLWLSYCTYGDKQMHLLQHANMLRDFGLFGISIFNI
jgi:hypothetical protein